MLLQDDTPKSVKMGAKSTPIGKWWIYGSQYNVSCPTVDMLKSIIAQNSNLCHPMNQHSV